MLVAYPPGALTSPTMPVASAQSASTSRPSCVLCVPLRQSTRYSSLRYSALSLMVPVESTAQEGAENQCVNSYGSTAVRPESRQPHCHGALA